MKTGVVKLSLEYVVDIEDDDMVQQAKDALYDDLMSAYKNDKLGSWIKVEEAPMADPDDIPDFLRNKKCKECEERLPLDDFRSEEDDVCGACMLEKEISERNLLTSTE